MTPSEIQDAVVRDQILIEGYKKTLADEYLVAVLAALMTSFQDRINGLNVRTLSELTPRQVSTLIRRLELDTFGIEQSRRTALLTALREMAKVQEGFARDLSGVGGRLSPVKTFGEVEDTPAGYGETLAAILAAWSAAHNKRIAAAVRRATVEGSTPSEVITSVRGTKRTKFQDGLMAQTERGIDTAISTATQHVSVVTMATVFSGLSGYYRWVSVLDNRTSTICRALAGRVFEFGKGPLPPQHPNCRSSIMPVSSKQAKGPERPTYYDWLKKQPTTFQDRVLGKARAKVFRDGNLSTTEFARLQLDKNFKPLTLDELRREVPAAFKAAKPGE